MLILLGEIFLKAYVVINEFSDIVFFKERFTPHMEGFSVELPTPDTLEFLKSGTFRFSKQEHQFLSWQTLIIFSKLK